MDFKFYIYNKDGLHNYLCCKDENNRIFLYKKYKYQKNEWLYIDNKTEWQEKYMAEITEQAAEDFCFNYVYRTPVKIRKKTYASLHDLPDPLKEKLTRKQYFLVIGLGIASFLIMSIIMLTVDGDPTKVLYFWSAALLITGGGLFVGKIFNLDDLGEAIALFILIALVLFKIFR